MGNTFYFNWEVALIEFCQKYIPSFVIEILSFISNIGDTIFVVAIVSFIYLCYNKELGKKVISSTIMALLFAGQLKNIFIRRRPYFDHENIKCLKIVDKNYDLYDVYGQGYSFPSMHSSNITTVGGTIYHYFKTNKTLVIAILASLVVGVSRFILGCHYPTDVLIGWILGVICAILVPNFLDKVDSKKAYIVEIIIGLIGCFFCTTKDYYQALGILLGFIATDIFESKYVKFENTRSIARIICRLLLALGAFVITDFICKLPFSTEVLENSGYISHFLTITRYALSCFVAFGITSLLYKYNILKIKEK